MDSDSIADEDDQNILPFSSSNEHHVNFSCDEDENSRVFCFNDGYMTELTDSSKADLVDLQTSSRMNFLTGSEGISHCSTNIGESLSQTHNELLTDSVTEKCEYNEEKSTKNKHQKMKEYEKILSVELKKSCDVENNTVARFFQTEEKDELIRKMANHIKCIWNILLQFGGKLDKAKLLTEKEKLVIQGEYEDGYLPLKISQDEGEKDNQLSLSRLLVSSFEEPGEFSLCTNNCNSSHPNIHLKDKDITSSDYHSPLCTSVCGEETSRNNINSSTFQNKHVNNPVIKRSKARKSFTQSHKSHHLQDKNQQNMMHIPHNCLNSKNETINSCVDDKKDPFQIPSKQALHEQDTPSKQRLLVADSSVPNIEMSNSEIKETIQSADSVTGLIQNDVVLSGEESDQVKSSEIQNIFLCKNIKNLERNLVESPAINRNTATSAKKMARDCDALLKDQISASDISSRLSNDKILNLDSLNAKTLLDKLNNPFVKQAKARKQFSKNQNSTYSLEEKSHLESNLSIGTSDLENNIGICGKQKPNINSSFKQIPCIEAEDPLKEKDFLSPCSVGVLLPEFSEQISYRETNSYSANILSIDKKVADIRSIPSFTEKVADSVMPTSINGIKKSDSQAERTQLNFSQQGHEFQGTVSFGHNPKLLDSQENNNSMKQKVLLEYKDSLKKQTVGDSSDIDHNLSESNEIVERPDLLLTEKETFRTQSKQTYSVGSNYQLENDLTLSDDDDTLDCDLERNSKSQTSSLNHFDALCPATPESIGSFHKCEENAFSMSDNTFAESQNVNSSIVDSSSNEVVGISCTNINKLHSEFLNSPIVKKAKARKKFSRKQNLDHSVNNKTQQNALSDSFERLNSEKGIISSFTENLKIDVSSFQTCNSNREEPFLMKYPRHSLESSELGVYEENKITEKTSQALCNTDGNTIELNPIICGPPLRDSGALNRDMHLLSEDMSKNNDFVEQNSLVVSSAKNSANEGNNNDLTQLYVKESSNVSLIEKGSCNVEYEKMSSPPNKNADQCDPDFLEEKNNNIEQSDKQRKNFVECGKDAWKNLDDMSIATSEKLITSQTCSKNLLSVHTNAVFENGSNPVNSSKSENSSSADQSPDKDVAVSRGIFTLFQNSILNPFIEQARARKKVTKKPNSASSLGDKVQNVSCNFSSQILCDKMKTRTSEKKNTQISGLLPKQNSEISKENIKEYTFTKDICTPVVKFINQTQDEERKSFIQNSFSIPSTSISQLEASRVHPRFSVSENELKSNACIKQDFVQENPVSEDFDFVTGKSISSENNFISKAPLQLDPMTSEDGVLTTENVTDDNPGKSLHSTKSIDLLKNDLAISDDETDELCEFVKDKSTEDIVLTTSFSKNLNLISESKKVQSSDLNLGNNSSHLSNAESAYQNNNLPSKNLFYNPSQTAFRLENNTVKFKNSSSPKNLSYLSQRTNTSFDEDPVKQKPNIPETAGTEMVHGHLNESIEQPVEAQLLESTSKRKRAEDFDLDNFAKNPIKKSFNGLSSEESSLSTNIINSVLHGPSVSANWEKFPVTTRDASGNVEECVKPGIHVLNNNISEAKENLSSTIDDVNSSIKGPLKKKLKPIDSVTACLAPIRVRGRTSQFRAFSKKFSNEFDKNSKDNGYGNSNELQDNSPKNFDQDKIIESYISTKKPKIRKEHQKVKNSNKTLISHNTGTVLNLKEASSEYSTQFSQQDAKISLKEPAVSSEFSEQYKLFTTSKSHLMIQSSTEDKIEALNKTPKAEKGHKRIGNEKNTYILFDNTRPEKNMNLIFSVKEKDLEDKSLELCSSVKPPLDLNNGESIVNGCENMLGIDNKIKFMHTESECLTSKKRTLNSEMEPVTKKNLCSRNSESTISNFSSRKSISSLSENLFVYDNLVSKTMEENWHFESDSDRELLIDEGGEGKDLKSECLELCSSMDPPPDLSSRESIVNGSENMLNIDNKIKCLPSKSKGFTSKKRPLNSDIETVMKKQNCTGNSESTISNSSSSKSIFTSTENFSAHDNSLIKAIEDDGHLENYSDQNLVINDKPGTYDNSVDEHFQETSEKLSNAKSSCLDLLEEICNFDKDSYNINFKNIIPSDNNETSFSKPLLPSKSSLNSARISTSGKSESFPLDEILSESIVTSITVSSSVTNFQSRNQTSITVSKTKTAATSNPECKSSDAIIVPKFSKQKSRNNAKEGFIKKGNRKFQHSKLVESIIENKNCKSVKNEADLPFSLGIEEILDNIRGVHADSESFKNYVDSLTKFLICPQNAPDTAVLIFLVVHYLHLRGANLLLKFLHNQEGYPFLLSTENCIVTALIEIEKMAKPHLQGFLKSLLSVMYNLILEKKKLNFYGMSSLCRVFTELCKRNGDKQKPILLCCDLIKQKHRNSPFLIASIAGVWKELFEIPDNFSDEYISLLSSIAYGAQKRIPKISKSCQECSSKIIEEYIAVPSIPNAKQAIELLKEQIVLKSLQSSFENLWCLTSSLAILASWEPWIWTEQTLLNDYIVTNLKRFSSQDLNEQAFDLFCDLYVDIYFLSPTKFADKVLIKFVERKVASKEKEFVQDCAAAALMKYLILAKREVPASLTVFFGKNPDNPKTKLFEDILRRRIPTSAEKLSIKDVMNYV
ncbi:hypothetical protein AVEN_141194-1 [Araneus ventricosus]|uniref:Uncharacterized protein n=1 Tax=Araneus ventricosus TaxID=182803 RepID=A0A4Y2EU07_ARAVE|nr:hypothetical protein AVEN_141194-1 [Araneus ventricosus]